MSRSQKNRPRNILVVAAHPDDEILGCGGTMARHARSGDRVHVLILAEGLTSRNWPAPVSSADQRALVELQKIARKANSAVGVKDVEFGGFPDNRMDSLDLLTVVKRVEQSISRVNPDIVYTHHAGDVNVDHQIASKATMTATRPIPGHPVKRLLFFEVVSSTHWQTSKRAGFYPSWFQDISSTLDSKIKALKVYEREMRPWPHARSYKAVQSLAEWRGSTAGLAAAEGFEVGRVIE